MQIENHKEEVPFAHYKEQFQTADPQDVCARLKGVAWDGEKFTVTLMGREYEITHPEFTLTPTDGGSQPPLPVQTFLMRYLMFSRDVAWGGQWKTFREMPSGELYIKPYTGRVLTRAAYSFGTRVDAFRAACEKMGAVKLSHGDAGYQFDFIGDYRIQILAWAGDDEFPPNAQVIYTDNFSDGFAPEDRVVAGDILISAIKANM